MRLQGPESLAFKDGFIYTGIMGGEIVRMDLEKKEEWEVYYRSGEDCKALHEEHKCGHPLGIRFDSRQEVMTWFVRINSLWVTLLMAQQCFWK